MSPYIFYPLLMLALVDIAGCAPQQREACIASASGSTALEMRKDQAACAIEGDRLCIGEVWIRLKCSTNIARVTT